MAQHDLPRIMVVDDFPDQCDTLKERIESTFEVWVDAFYDGDSMFDRLNEPDGPQYRIVILDMHLPRRRGGSVEATLGLRLLRAYHVLAPGTPIIIYTAHESYENCVDCIKSGAYDYIPKVESGKDRLLESCRAILSPRVDELDEWVAQNGKDLVERYGDMYVAILPIKEVTGASLEFSTLGDRALIAGYSMGEVRFRLLMSEILRWLEPKIIKVPRPRKS